MSESPFGIVELRRYVVHPGKAAVLAELFERVFIESQIACGMLPIGQFRDLDDPNLFVWFRGFADMRSRLRALTCFYRESSAWRDNRDAANATMVDSDNVLMLRPAPETIGFDLVGLKRAAIGVDRPPKSSVVVMILALRAPADDALVATFQSWVLGNVDGHGDRLAFFVSADEPNDFPALPVRETPSLVAVGVCRSTADVDVWDRTLHANLPPALAQRVADREFLRLAPLPRSLFG
jgi:hypothetical protein